ncbi:MAG: winged helix-turn-helix domain-containing protein [Desulfobaccales bacterium]
MIDRYARWIVVAPDALGGSARREEVHSYVQKVFGREFPESDRECIYSGETRWVKNVDWAKFELKKAGLLNKNAPWGVWELTEKGKTFYK